MERAGGSLATIYKVFGSKDGLLEAVVFEKAEGAKCERCWKVLPDVGSDPRYPDLSPRDAAAMAEIDDAR